jgi:GNAT superfamily N-acetyltransferase
MHFTPDYQEEIALDDGTIVRLRLIRPDDKPRLVEILARLSPLSRTMRFFAARARFTQNELRHLTELDGIDHVAILVLRGEESLGVARFVRSERGGLVAEPALAVIDEFQGRGIGRILVRRLAAAAHERGIRRFEAEVLPRNGAALRLLRELDGSVPRHAAASWYSITCTVDISRAHAA